MATNLYPDTSAALFNALTGLQFTDPGVDALSAHNPVFTSGKYVLKPLQDEVMGLIAKHLEAGGAWRIYNGTGGTLTKGTLLYISGIQGPIEAGDTATQLSSWVIRGMTLYNSNFGLLYWELTNTGDPTTGTRTVKLYKSIHKQSTDEVASGSRSGDGSITLTASNSSGITGTVTVAWTADDTDTANTLTCNCLTVAKADANDPAKLASLVVKADLSNATAGIGYGRATVTGIDTSGAAADGSKLFLDQSVTGTAGGFVEDSAPSGDYAGQEVGTVEVKHATEGSAHFYPAARIIQNFSSAMIGGTSILNVGSVGKWYKFTVTHAQLQAAGLTNDISLATLPAATILHARKIKHSTAFAGTGITEYYVSVGISTDLTKYMPEFDVLQATGNTVQATDGSLDTENHGATADLRVAGRSVGANLDQSTQGSVDIWVFASKAA